MHPDESETWVSPYGVEHDVPPATYPVTGVTDTGPPEAAVSDEAPAPPFTGSSPGSEAIRPWPPGDEPEPDPPPDLTPAEIDGRRLAVLAGPVVAAGR